MDIKALTISQPYASMIASGEKWIENRTWATTYRGPLAIHAGKGTQYMSRAELRGWKLPTAQIIAVSNLVACVTRTLITENGTSAEAAMSMIPGTYRTWAEALDHRHCEGPYCWILEGARLVEPVTCNGKQGLWLPEASIAAVLIRRAQDND